MSPYEPVPFVSSLERLNEQDDRRALAVLRRSMGKEGEGNIESLRYIVPWLPEKTSPWKEKVHFIIASLFATHPEKGGPGSLGAAYAECLAATDSESVERRFISLLNSNRDNLAYRLRHSVSLIRSKGCTIDWHQLFRDLLAWEHPERYVQKKWAKDFWRSRVNEVSEDNTIEEAL